MPSSPYQSPSLGFEDARMFHPFRSLLKTFYAIRVYNCAVAQPVEHALRLGARSQVRILPAHREFSIAFTFQFSNSC